MRDLPKIGFGNDYLLEENKCSQLCAHKQTWIQDKFPNIKIKVLKKIPMCINLGKREA